MVSLMRIVELSEGRIVIDGQDIGDLGLTKLRKNIAVIPQDPVLFSGSIRSNLDPFDEFQDQSLIEILQRTGLYANTSSNTSLSSLGLSCINSLEDGVSEGGINFSVGQRQLLVIARALLRGAKIVVMDEATAVSSMVSVWLFRSVDFSNVKIGFLKQAVDAETDAAIQKVMRTEFASATCITVAHRLNTIMDSDFILVMSDGVAVEFDTPSKLLQAGGMFRDLVQAATTD
jgi:ABC-type multidrug transport system fused ATPase/permease subunit